MPGSLQSGVGNIMKNTKLVLELDVGDFPEDTDPDAYYEYLYQSDHLIQDCVIIGVRQE